MPPSTLARRYKNFLSILDFDAAGLEYCLDLAIRMKADRRLGAQGPSARLLDGRYVAMLFEKIASCSLTTA